MADIVYTRAFTHDDWIDNEDVVQAGGERGFNKKFHTLETEFDSISGVVGQINTAIKNVQRLDFMLAQPPIDLPPNTVSAEFPVDNYDRTGMPPNVEKVYFAIILPVSGSTHIQDTFLYRQLPGNRIGVSVQFFNPGTTSGRFAFRIMSMSAAAV